MNRIFLRRYSFSSPRRNLFQNLYSHFRHAQNAKKMAEQRGIILSKLTDEQKEKLKPIFRLQALFRVVNITMGLMGVIAFSIWYRRRNQRIQQGKQINEQLKPIWMNLEHFKHKAALIKDYLLPEQIISKLNQIERLEFQSTDCVCASFPKSGTTLLEEIVFLIQTNFDYQSAKKSDISERFAFIEWPTVKLDQFSANQYGKSRFFKTHLPPKFFNETLSKAKVIYVYRNPKDVTVSLFHFLRSIKIELTYSGPWNQFVKSFLIDEGFFLL